MGKIELKVCENTDDDDSDDELVAYLRLPGHPGPGAAGCVAKTIRLFELIGEYSGPEINLDFDENNQLIGIEILE
ncbi:MAG: DUF2283 domain-containing protein [Proteobacteria bacterium]|nr:DUF2283 domain-containing protein [Pseudomonadota bacterium]